MCIPFVVLRANPNHRRAKLVELSDKGFTALEEVYRRHNVWAEDFVRGLTSEELKTTFATMAEIRQRLERAGN
jgi:DNA-binding MarR family transcriptional regulator